jgi:DNA-binding transcriptional LysR family regulator
MVEWSDLRFFLAIARHGSTLAAARALGVNQSTVQRRIGELERGLGQTLVLRHPTGYQLTECGKSLVPAAEKIEAEVIALERQAQAYGQQLDGVIRLTCPEPLVSRIANSDLLRKFHEHYPGLRVEIVMSDRYLDLARGEADVALRSGEPTDENLVGRRIGDSIWAVYASRSYVQQHGRPASVADMSNHAIVGFEGALAGHRAARWFASVAPSATVAASNNSVLGVLMAVKSGVGVAPLPTAIAAMHEDLVQVLPPVEELNRGWYLLAHPDLRGTPRVSAFFDFVTSHLDAVRPILMG